jgi:putative peptide zinc metalloprotease protein
MDKAAPASDLERRKKVRIRLRGDLAIAPQKYEGRTYYVVKDPVSLRYYRFKEQEHFLIQLMNGRHTLDDAQKEFEKRFRPERLTLEDLEGFAQQLLTAGLAQNESPQAGKQLFDRRKKRLRSEWMQALTNILYIKIPIFDPDKLLTKMVGSTSWIFTNWFLLLSVGIMLSAVMLVAIHFETFLDRLPAYHEFFSFKTVVYLWVALGVVKVIHEFGHGLSCKAFGGECHEMGALFLVFSPCLYANVSDAWTLPNKWHRIIISAAGIYVELIIAALATFVWWQAWGVLVGFGILLAVFLLLGQHWRGLLVLMGVWLVGQLIITHVSKDFQSNMALSLMVVCSVSTVVFNANPLMRYDGYYVLADWLEIPNLRDRSNRFLKNLMLEHCLGVEVQPEQYMALWRKVLFVAYAVISYVYRWVVTYSILWFMYNFLKPYKLGVISAMLAMAALGSMIGWPLYRVAKNLNKRGRLPDMKPVRVTLSAAAVGLVVLFVFLVPLPVSRVRQTALVQVHPDAIKPVFAPHEPNIILDELLVRDGDVVEEGQELARFTCPDLELQRTEAKAEWSIREGQVNALRKQREETTDPQEKNRIDVQLTTAERERARFAQEVALYDERLARLVLKAPASGKVMSPPRVDDIGKMWDEKDLANPFCSVGDPSRLRVVVPVEPAYHRLISQDLGPRQDGQLPVTVRVQGLADLTWEGKLETPLAQQSAEELPLALTNKGGGPIAVKPTQPTRPGYHQPQSQQYLLFVDVVKPDRSITPGSLAQVKIYCRPHTIAWWLWRTVSDKFELGLI